MTIKEEYEIWVRTKVVAPSRWRRLTKEQKWFVFVNAREVPQPKIASPKSSMIWSVSKKSP